MNNHLNILPKQAKFDLKSSKMRWRLGKLTTLSIPLIVRETPHHEFLVHHWFNACSAHYSALGYNV